MPDLSGEESTTAGQYYRSTHANWMIDGTHHQNTTFGAALMVALTYAVTRLNEGGGCIQIELADCPSSEDFQRCLDALTSVLAVAQQDVVWPTIRTNERGEADDSGFFMAIMNPGDWLNFLWRECREVLGDAEQYRQLRRGMQDDLSLLATALLISEEEQTWQNT